MNKYQVEAVVALLAFFYCITVFMAFVGVFAILHDPRFIHNAEITGDYSWFNYWLPALIIYVVIGVVALNIIGKWSQRTTKKARSYRSEHEKHKQYLRTASKLDYVEWLDSYKEITNMQPTHEYDYKFPTESFYVAIKDFTIEPLYGSASLNIIVPEHVMVTGELGHTNLYLHGHRPEAVGFFVPHYNDLDSTTISQKITLKRRDIIQKLINYIG